MEFEPKRIESVSLSAVILNNEKVCNAAKGGGRL